MAKPEMVCPFSKKICIECAQFRARHYYYCFAPRYRGYYVDENKLPSLKHRSSCGDQDVQGPPMIERSSKWLTNLEDCL